MVKICFIPICATKIFFVKIICSTHQRKCFCTILGNNWKIDFLTEYRQARIVENIFCQNYLFHSSKEVFSTLMSGTNNFDKKYFFQN